FPHGFHFIADAMVVGGENQRLLTGDANRLLWVREQVEMLLTHAVEDEQGRVLIPQKYTDPDAVIEFAGSDSEPMTRPDRITTYPNFTRKKQIDGWFEFRPLNPSHMAHVYADSLDPTDLEVSRKIRDRTNNTWDHVSMSAVHGKDYSGQNHAYLNFLDGGYPNYPTEALLHSIEQVYTKLRNLRQELALGESGWGYRPGSEKVWQELAEATRQVNEMKEKQWSESVTHSYFQTYLIGRSTITTEALVHLTMGGPMPIYNGGLLKVSIRHFDADRQRPGLPPDVSALVHTIDDEGIDLTLANLHTMETRRVIVQAGAFAEHCFTTARYADDEGHSATCRLDTEHVEIEQGPGTVFDIRLGLQRYCRQPSYRLPWDR
ncbi:MAG: hypothetical protein O2782_20295, partial [bacterium]|nr:hypothetical protein [bacterium]